MDMMEEEPRGSSGVSECLSSESEEIDAVGIEDDRRMLLGMPLGSGEGRMVRTEDREGGVATPCDDRNTVVLYSDTGSILRLIRGSLPEKMCQ